MFTDSIHFPLKRSSSVLLVNTRHRCGDLSASITLAKVSDFNESPGALEVAKLLTSSLTIGSHGFLSALLGARPMKCSITQKADEEVEKTMFPGSHFPQQHLLTLSKT